MRHKEKGKVPGVNPPVAAEEDLKKVRRRAATKQVSKKLSHVDQHPYNHLELSEPGIVEAWSTLGFDPADYVDVKPELSRQLLQASIEWRDENWVQLWQAARRHGLQAELPAILRTFLRDPGMEASLPGEVLEQLDEMGFLMGDRYHCQTLWLVRTLQGASLRLAAPTQAVVPLQVVALSGGSLLEPVKNHPESNPLTVSSFPKSTLP